VRAQKKTKRTQLLYRPNGYFYTFQSVIIIFCAHCYTAKLYAFCKDGNSAAAALQSYWDDSKAPFVCSLAHQLVNRNYSTAVKAILHLYDLLWICCGIAAELLYSSSFWPTFQQLWLGEYDNFDILAACWTINVASAVAMLYLHTAATVCSFKRVSVTKTKFLYVIDCGADKYQINK